MQTLIRAVGPREEVLAALRAIPEVVRVDERPVPSDPALRLVITSKSDEVRGAVGRTIVERGWTLLEVSPIALTLEDLFVKLVRGEPH